LEAIEVSNDWSAPTDWETVCRRNAGRRHYNNFRRLRRTWRRMRVAELLCKYGLLTHGARARIARELGVHKSVVTRDVQALLHTHAPCPCCGSVVRKERLGAG
jgi:hypothetical protein